MNKHVTAIIGDDEPWLLDHLCRKLKRLWPELEIVGKAANGLEAEELFIKYKPDIAFLDIRMPGKSGLDVAQNAAPDCRIVFITAYADYAVEAFEKAAVDYLLKPLTDKRLLQTIKRLQHDLHRPKTLRTSKLPVPERAGRDSKKYLQWLNIKQGRVVKIIPVANVLFFQAEDGYTKVVTEDEEYFIRISIKQLCEDLDSDQFWCVHRSTIVNSYEIDRVKKSMSHRFVVSLKKHSHKITVSRRFGHLFKQM